MKIKLFIFFTIVSLTQLSCNYGSEHGGQNSFTISKMYIYDIAKDSTKFIGEGYSINILPTSKKLLYFHTDDNALSTLRLYDYATCEDVLLLNNFYAYIDEYSISPDEKYLSYIKGKTLSRINLDNGSNEILLSSPNQLIAPPRYSNDGKRLIYLCNPGNNFSDSICVNIYDFDSGNSVSLDTLFIKGNDLINAYFTNNSQKFYILRRGYDKRGYFQIQLTIYINSISPEPFKIKTFYPFDHQNKVFNINDDKLLILDNKNIFQYDISEDISTGRINFSIYHQLIKKVKNLDRLIGTETNNSIAIINFDGTIENVFVPRIEDNIVWADYSINDGYIYFNSSRVVHR
jgi:hypothetical protein